MNKLKLTKERISLILITILSAVLNLANQGIEGTANAYYAAAAKSMTTSFKNFFFVSFDPAGFVTIDKPPLGYWLQAISAKIFGFSGWSIILPQSLAGVISVVIIYLIVKRTFGSAAGLISALCLAVTPVFVAASRNNTVDNVLVLALLFACWELSIAAEKGKFKYIILSMILVGIGFNIKMLQAYMIVPALYITYLLTTAVSFKKRIIHLAAGTVILFAVSLSWAIVVDSIPANSRPYIDSSTNNTVMELIVGHNGLERLSLISNQNPGGGPDEVRQMPQQPGNNTDSTSGATQSGSTQSSQGFPGNPPPNADNQNMSNNGPMGPGSNLPTRDDGMRGPMGGGSAGLQGTFGGQVKSSITRLFSKNILSDQIVWFLPLAVFGFVAAAIREKLGLKLDNKRKQSLSLWFMWFLPVFIYFSFNTGTFHSYYLTMLAPPAAALTGIGMTSMWELYKEGTWKSWFLPASLFVNGAVQLLMLYYFIDTSSIVRVMMILLIVLCFGASSVLSLINISNKIGDTLERKLKGSKKILVSAAFAGLLITPFVGSSAVLFHSLNGSFPAAGLELLSSTQEQGPQMNGNISGNSNSSLVDFLLKNKTQTQKYLLVVSSANEAADIIINTGEPVMAIGGFLGEDKSITLDQFIGLVKKGEVRYVMTGGNRGGVSSGGSSASEIMSWVQQNGSAVSASEYNSAVAANSQNSVGSSAGQDGRNPGGFGSKGFGQLYDLKTYTDNSSAQ